MKAMCSFRRLGT